MLELWVEFVSIPFCVTIFVRSKFFIICGKPVGHALPSVSYKKWVGRTVGQKFESRRGSDYVTNLMVSPGTHLVKNHESLSITNESQLKYTRSPELKILGPL